jgi:nicotinate dehydrogenase subunit B
MKNNLPHELERYELNESPQHRFEVDRRTFFKVFGAGLAVVAVVPRDAVAQQGESGRRREGGEDVPRQISAWLHIGEDGAVTVYTGKVEVGQNVRTSLAQQVADELRAPLNSITLMMGDTQLTPFDMGTFGSRTTPQMGTQLRRIAAGARGVLVARAAQMFGQTTSGAAGNLPQAAGAAETTNLIAENGKVTNRNTGQSLSYAELLRGQHLFEQVVDNPALMPAAAWHVAGTAAPKSDGRAFVIGAHQYTSDIRRPGMVYGKVVRPSAFKATLVSADASAAEQLPQVKVVRDGDFVGVTAPSSFAAQQAADKIKTEWKAPPQPSNAELFKLLKEPGRQSEGQGFGGQMPHVTGNVAQALERAEHRIERTYTVQYIAHAPLEPRAAVAEWNGEGGLTVWTGSQRPFGVREELAGAFHLPAEKVRVIVPDTGAAYGGKHTGECAIEAARLAKAAGKPVKLVWTREEEFTWAYFRPAGVIEVKAGADAKGRLTAWEFHNYNSGPSAIGTPYSAPNQHIEFHPADSPLRQGSYRGLAATANHFARECAMNELALIADVDRLEFRLRNLANAVTRSSDSAVAQNTQFDPARLRAVFQAAAEKFGWGKKTAVGYGYGIAGGFEKGGYVACIAEVMLDMKQEISPVKIGRVVEAWDCGAVVNPEGLRNQIAGAIAQGIGGALYEAVQFQNGRIQNPHFAQYRVPRFADMPSQIEVVLIDRKDKPPAGAGETPIVGIAPALAEGIYQASGFVRLRALPLAPNGVNCGCTTTS